jgi:D-alanyl-D-alanine carboxypeptidase (penicillin-binding protein 5/6)
MLKKSNSVGKILFGITAFILSIVIIIGVFVIPIEALPSNEADNGSDMKFNCRSALLMEAETGKVLFEQNADEALPPASVTKIMTLLLVMEAIDSGKIGYDDMVTASAHACSMGGSQIYLKEGEQMSVEDMLKSVVIASANDAAVALAEYVLGTEEAFVGRMNERAKELGMTSTTFENTNGLDDTATNHLTSARDIAIMSRELLKHKKITEYSSIWMDSIRNGEFGLTNTNRLVRFYKGATGLKTGSTSKAGFCISSTATRDGMTLICVIMGAESRDIRNAAAVALLDFGFANYAVFEDSPKLLEKIKVKGGVATECEIITQGFSAVINKSNSGKIETVTELPEDLEAPIKKGEVIGKIIYNVNGNSIGETEILANENVEKIDFWGVFKNIFVRVALL